MKRHLIVLIVGLLFVAGCATARRAGEAVTEAHTEIVDAHTPADIAAYWRVRETLYRTVASRAKTEYAREKATDIADMSAERAAYWEARVEGGSD